MYLKVAKSGHYMFLLQKIVVMWGNGYVNLTVIISQSMYIRPSLVHLKLIQCCMSIIFQQS